MPFINQPLGPSKAVTPHCSTQDPGGGVGSRSKGWRWVGLGLGLGIRWWRWVGLCICKEGGRRWIQQTVGVASLSAL